MESRAKIEREIAYILLFQFPFIGIFPTLRD
jgi:hypothetical protein